MELPDLSGNARKSSVLLGTQMAQERPKCFGKTVLKLLNLRIYLLVISAGFEPTTPGLGIRCSILLSYETTGRG